MKNSITIDEAQALVKAMEASISKQLQDFEAKTALTIHSVPVHRDGATVGARVKVQIPT